MNQLAAVASLTRSALAAAAPRELIADAIAAAQSCLGAECVGVVEVRAPDELAVVARVSNAHDEEGSPQSTPERYPQAEYTLEVGGPVVARDLRRESRFPTSALLRRGLSSGLTAIITVDGAPYGVIGSFASRPLPLTDEDVFFFQTVADVVGIAIERDRHREAQSQTPRPAPPAGMGQLAASAAHELSNVVATIGLYTELLARQQRLDQAGLGQVAAIRDQVERGAALVSQLLDTASRGPLQLQTIDMAALVEELLPALRRAVPKGVVITAHHDGLPHSVQGDTLRLQELFTKAIADARDALNGPGDITIDISPDDDVPVASADSGQRSRRDGVRIEITVTGPGMNPEVLARAVEPLFTTESAGQASGVGLSPVRGLIDEHDGRVELVSTPGVGSTVRLWLPAPPSTGRAEPSPPPASPQGRGQRVLVVDDDPAMRAALANTLNRLGYAATEAASAEKAVSTLEDQASSIAVVVCDVVMPGMGGETLAQSIASRWPATPVILVSGYPPPFGAAHPPADPSGSGGVVRLQKPFSSRQIAQALSAALHDT
jgi:signal transduction histidine kinase/ActR/RegA family two-component response regulator